MTAPTPSRAMAQLEAWRHRLAASRWRGMLWVSGDAASTLNAARCLLASRRWRSPLFVGEQGIGEQVTCKQEGGEQDIGQSTVIAELGASGSTVTQLSRAKARTRLGTEHELVIYNAVGQGEGLDPDALGAVAGTVMAGGLLVLLTADDGGLSPDADYRRLAAHPWRSDQLSSHYLARCHRLLGSLEGVARWRLADRVLEVPPLDIPSLDLPESSMGAASPQDGECLSQDQAEAVARLVQLRRRRPLVLTADRGRGKSAALGIACARILARAEQRGERVEVLLTAPRPAAVATVFEHFSRLSPGARPSPRALHSAKCMEVPGGVLRYVAPDALSAMVTDGEAGGAGSVLLVDEAAAIPAALLGEWLAAFPRIAFATTEHGYEGSGRGFALRFRRRLDELTPQWQGVRLETPVRWAAGDPLEVVISRLLLLDADAVEVAPWQDGQISLVEPAGLAADESTLRAIFGLLIQAHYRTTPTDLRALLDAPSGAVMTLGSPTAPAGVVVWSDEGGFDTALADQVALGQRRPRGHLLAQSLAVHAGERGALEARVRRVTRIAVHPDGRRQGAGAQLLGAAFHWAQEEGTDLLGASFGGDAELLAFWRSQGYRVVRLGLTRETATGEHALMVLKACSEQGERLLERLEVRFQRLLPRLLAFELNDLAPQMVHALLVATAREATLDDADHRDAEDIVGGYRDLALMRPAIQQLIQVAAGAEQLMEEDAWLAAWAFQGRSDSQLAHALGLNGRTRVKQWLRDRVGRVLASAVDLSMGNGRG